MVPTKGMGKQAWNHRCERPCPLPEAPVGEWVEQCEGLHLLIQVPLHHSVGLRNARRELDPGENTSECDRAMYRNA